MIAGQLCGTCRGYGVRPMTKDERRARSRTLRAHKRAGTTPPPPPRITCEPCQGRGWLPDNVTPIRKDETRADLR